MSDGSTEWREMCNGSFGLPRFAFLCRVLCCLSAPQIEIEKPLFSFWIMCNYSLPWSLSRRLMRTDYSFVCLHFLLFAEVFHVRRWNDFSFCCFFGQNCRKPQRDSIKLCLLEIPHQETFRLFFRLNKIIFYSQFKFNSTLEWNENSKNTFLFISKRFTRRI